MTVQILIISVSKMNFPRRIDLRKSFLKMGEKNNVICENSQKKLKILGPLPNSQIAEGDDRNACR